MRGALSYPPASTNRPFHPANQTPNPKPQTLRTHDLTARNSALATSAMDMPPRRIRHAEKHMLNLPREVRDLILKSFISLCWENYPLFDNWPNGERIAKAQLHHVVGPYADNTGVRNLLLVNKQLCTELRETLTKHTQQTLKVTYPDFNDVLLSDWLNSNLLKREWSPPMSAAYYASLRHVEVQVDMGDLRLAPLSFNASTTVFTAYAQDVFRAFPALTSLAMTLVLKSFDDVYSSTPAVTVLRRRFVDNFLSYKFSPFGYRLRGRGVFTKSVISKDTLPALALHVQVDGFKEQQPFVVSRIDRDPRFDICWKLALDRALASAFEGKHIFVQEISVYEERFRKLKLVYAAWERHGQPGGREFWRRMVWEVAEEAVEDIRHLFEQ
ncbi:uncharacterized protein BKCO1_2100027 [Diplodia corticola]|uniref:Uncharacterized protein n=1 Tax=Diplodia corticola TaxID=236234 RepID=A0A1J9S526_9PEZI|nr:uncharacterized protein BKCO1_2100027 [Diplodia corticola]OJD34725.1 hypothetical protein BKCO1_2100027 [Diplodia corticola]